VQRRIAPELTERIVLRHNILRHVWYSQPIGRRALAQCIGRTKRVVRREEGVLREIGLILVGSDGIRLSRDGEDILEELGSMFVCSRAPENSRGCWLGDSVWSRP